MNPQSQQAAIERITAEAMGLPPQVAAGADPAAAAAQAAQTSPQAAQQAAQQAAPIPNQVAAKTQTGKVADTPEGQAQGEGAPSTEGEKMTRDAVLYEVEFGEGDMRKLTPEQIKATFERYSALNFRNAQYKPVMDLVDQIMKANPGSTPAQVRQELENILRANQSNPTMGQQGTERAPPPGQQGAPQTAEEMSEALKRWEEENAASLPPGYQEMMMGQSALPQTLAQMQQQMATMQRMMQAVLGESQGVAEAARSGMDQSQGMQVQAVRQQIANNIDRVQQALQLPDEAAQDFMIFAAERGFTMEDFVDPQLTIKVMTDFRNSMNSPEMDRLRGIAQRRQAYTGSLGSTPSAGGAAAAAATLPGAGQGTTFDRLAGGAMSQRGLG
jgi:hypothetical protein